MILAISPAEKPLPKGLKYKVNFNSVKPRS